MISHYLLNEMIKTREFIITSRLVIRRKINDNLVDTILNYITPFKDIYKDDIKSMFGLIVLITNRIYYMYVKDIPDWMNYNNYNSHQEIIWNSNKFDIKKLDNIYRIILYLLKSHFNFNINDCNKNKNLLFKLNEDYFTGSLETKKEINFTIIKNWL